VRHLSADIGPRVAGSPEEIEARDYLAAELNSYGYDVTTPSFTFDAEVFLPVRVDAGGEPILGVALQGGATGAVSGALVSTGIGRVEEFPAGGLQGAIALVERGELTFQEKAENALDAGAAGVIVYNNQPGTVIGDLGDRVDIPVVGISADDGTSLAVRLQGGESITATITVTDSQATAYNVVARPPGTDACDTVTGGHFDSVPTTDGADDNASGTAAVLETARIVAARSLPGAHCFVLFGAEEFGLFGSRNFVQSLSDDEVNGLRAMINLDVVGLPQDLELIGSDDLIAQAGLIADGLGLPSKPSFVPNGAGSDHLSFINAGIPAVFFYRHDPLIHTPEDAIGRISPDSLAQTAEVAAALLAELAA
jgi:Zn-dependent M28 family amino/carboxypeptidase